MSAWLCEKRLDGRAHWGLVEHLEDDLGTVRWTDDANKATKFDSRHEAERVAAQLQGAAATEHVWTEPS